MGCFHFGAVVNNAAMNVPGQVLEWTYVFIPPGKILRSGIIGSYGNAMFNILEKEQNVFQNHCSILYSHQ